MRSTISVIKFAFSKLGFWISFILTFLTVLSGFFELITISLIIPLGSKFFESKFVDQNEFFHYFSVFSKYEFAGIFILMLTFSTFLRVVTTYVNYKFSYSCGQSLNSELFHDILKADYLRISGYTSSDIVAFCTTKNSNITGNVIISSIGLISNIVWSIFLFLAILINSPIAGGLIFSLLGINYIILLSIVKNRLYKNGDIVRLKSDQLMSHLTAASQNIKLIKLYNETNQNYSRFTHIDDKIQKAISSNLFISNSPRYIVELMAMYSIFIATFLLYKFGYPIQNILPSLAIVIFSSQKLLPSFQAIYNNLAGIRAGIPFLSEYIEIREKLKIHNVSELQKYDGTINNLCLKNLVAKRSDRKLFAIEDFSVSSGKLIGVTGNSGVGKSTFFDILCGFEEFSGKLFLNNIEINLSNRSPLNDKISLVPQEIYLERSIMRDAIMRYCNNSDEENVNLLIEICGITDSIFGCLNVLDMDIGENGSNISGGQKQRVAICQAFLSNRQIILFDEATNAIDKESEFKLIASLKSIIGNKIIFVISHNPDLLPLFDDVIDIRH